MSVREERDDDLASPDCARVLLTVRAAISFARFVDRPCFFSDSLMCSYWRSRFALHADCGISNPLLLDDGAGMPGAAPCYSSGGFWTLFSSAYFCVSSLTTSKPF